MLTPAPRPSARLPPVALARPPPPPRPRPARGARAPRRAVREAAPARAAAVASVARRGAAALSAAAGALFLARGRGGGARALSLADLDSPPVERSAVFSAGDARFLQAAFEDIRYKGISKIEVGRVDDGTRAVRVTYSSRKCSFKKLLGAFWKNIDPTDGGGQFTDRGKEFRPVVWVTDGAEREAARISMNMMEKSGVYGPPVVDGKMQGGKISQRPIVPFAVEVADAREFDPVPEDGQDFYKRKDEYDKLFRSTTRKAFFDEKYTPVSTLACEGGVCGFVYFPCTPDNGCTNVINGEF